MDNNKWNLNDRIKVKLTPAGIKVHFDYYNDINIYHNKEIIKEQDCLPKVDDDGYTHYQLWQFISIFGSSISMTGPNMIMPLDIINEEK